MFLRIISFFYNNLMDFVFECLIITISDEKVSTHSKRKLHISVRMQFSKVNVYADSMELNQ